MSEPHRTGIQRVSHEVISRWSGALIPVFMTEDEEFVRLPAHCLDLMQAFFQADSEDEIDWIKRQIEDLIDASRNDRIGGLSGYRALFTPEVFFCKRRTRLYQTIAEQREIEMFLVIYDFLPWTSPEAYPHGKPVKWYNYVGMMRFIPHLAYISDWSRQIAADRVFRGCRPAGVTIPLGSDGLGSCAPLFDSGHRGFSVVGTIEPRKGHVKILDAFERLWRDGYSIPLTFVGRRGWLSDGGFERIERLLAEQPLFAWHDNLTDPQVADVVKNSRATIYVSEHEGFGLPPVESLSLGTPVIVAAGIPSVDMIPALGQIRLNHPTPDAIQSAVLELTDDNRARKLTEEIADLDLLTWDASSKRYSDWIEETLQNKSRRTNAA